HAFASGVVQETEGTCVSLPRRAFIDLERFSVACHRGSLRPADLQDVVLESCDFGVGVAAGADGMGAVPGGRLSLISFSTCGFCIKLGSGEGAGLQGRDMKVGAQADDRS